MIMTKQNLKVTEVRYRNNSVKVMAVEVLEKVVRRQHNCPPKTKSSNEVRYNTLGKYNVSIDIWDEK